MGAKGESGKRGRIRLRAVPSPGGEGGRGRGARGVRPERPWVQGAEAAILLSASEQLGLCLALQRATSLPSDSANTRSI